MLDKDLLYKELDRACAEYDDKCNFNTFMDKIVDKLIHDLNNLYASGDKERYHILVQYIENKLGCKVLCNDKGQHRLSMR